MGVCWIWKRLVSALSQMLLLASISSRLLLIIPIAVLQNVLFSAGLDTRNTFFLLRSHIYNDCVYTQGAHVGVEK